MLNQKQCFDPDPVSRAGAVRSPMSALIARGQLQNTFTRKKQKGASAVKIGYILQPELTMSLIIDREGNEIN
jgi:hypothetical protein